MKIKIICSLLLINIIPLFADESEIKFSVGPIFEYSSGKLEEVLYHSVDSSKKISELIWDKNVFFYGVEIDARYKNFGILANCLKSISNIESGKMKDSDWLNTNNFNMKTTYSVGDNKVVENYDMAIEIYYEKKIIDKFSILPIIAVQYQLDSFKRTGAKGWYGNSEVTTDGNYHWWYEPESKEYPYYDEVKDKTYKLGGIDYERKSVFFWAGIIGKFYITPKDLFCLKACISPFNYNYAIDTHWAQNSSTKQIYPKHYKEEQTDYFSLLKFSMEYNRRLTKYFELKLMLETLLTIKNTKGTLSTDVIFDVQQDKYYSLNQNTHQGIRLFNYAISLKINLK